MSQLYTRKPIHNLKELNAEQERIRLRARHIEDGFLGFLSPQNLMMQAASLLLGKRKKSKKKTPTNPVMSSTTSLLRPAPQSKNRLAILAKKVGISFLKWQAFNLALYLGGKAMQKIKEKRGQRKAEKRIQKRLA